MWELRVNGKWWLHRGLEGQHHHNARNESRGQERQRKVNRREKQTNPKGKTVIRSVRGKLSRPTEMKPYYCRLDGDFSHSLIVYTL